MTNGGHITYVEVDGDPVNNLEAFEDLIRAMKDMGVGYGPSTIPWTVIPCAATRASSATCAPAAGVTTAKASISKYCARSRLHPRRAF